MPFFPKELTWQGVAKETTWGTAVSPTFYVPFKDVKPEDVINYVKDDGIRGAMATTYNVVPGVSNSQYQTDGEVFPDSIGLYILAMMGKDTVTGSAAPYTHTFQLARTSQPPSLTHSYYDGISERQYAGQMAEELQIKWSDGGSLEYTFKSQGMMSVVAGTQDTPAPSSTLPLQGWQFTAELGGNNRLNVVGFDMTMKRKLYVQHAANNTQDPTAIVAGGLDVEVKMTVDMMDEQELNDFLQNTQPSVVFTGNQVSSGDQMIFQFSKAAFLKDPITAKEVVQGDAEFDGVDNSTDGGPCQITLVNGVQSY